MRGIQIKESRQQRMPNIRLIINALTLRSRTVTSRSNTFQCLRGTEESASVLIQ